MIRYFLAQGDRAGSAVITEGLHDVTCANPPPAVRIATLYMKTYCSTCEQTGFVGPCGPRLGGTASNGQAWALSGDINVCGCRPAPVFDARRGMWMEVGPGPNERHTEYAALSPGVQSRQSRHDEQFVLRDAANGRPLADVRYRIRTGSGAVFLGVTDATGHTQRVATANAETLRIEIERV